LAVLESVVDTTFGNCYISRKQKDALNAQFRSLEETSSLTLFKKRAFYSF